MNTVIKMLGGCALAALLVLPAAAGSYEENTARCVTKYASANTEAQVMLECTADSGKLTACKTLEVNPPGKGFENAAICVADTLPVGSRTGTIKVPVRFVTK